MRNAGGSPVLEVEGVSHSYGARRALRNVSLGVAKGRFHILLGMNGAGKTTLFNLITRLFDARTGRIAVCGFDLRTSPGDALRRMGVVFQSRALDVNLTIAQNLVYQASLYGIGRTEALSRGAELLDRIGLRDRASEKISRLSGGQARRVEIIRAMLQRPKLLLCDEPTTGLDVKSRMAVVSDIHALAAAGQVGVLWATHLVDEVWPGDDITILHQGEVRRSGQAGDLTGGKNLSDTFLALTAEDCA